MRVLMITSEWPTPDKPYQVPFIVQQAAFLRKSGVDLDIYPFRGGKRPSRYARAWLDARKKIARGKYDLVHAQWGQSGLLALPKRIPLVVTFRGDDLEGIIGKNGRPTRQGIVLKSISRLVARAADQIILVSESLAQALPRRPWSQERTGSQERLWLPQRPYHVIPSGLDLQLFCPASQVNARQQLDLDPCRRYVLFAGASENPRKRFGLAQQAVDLLGREMDIELLVADHILHEQMPVYMNASDILLLTSLHEGSPNVVKEALACNLPVVSTDVGDVRQRIAAIAGCAILEDDRPEFIAATIKEVLLRGSGTESSGMIPDTGGASGSEGTTGSGRIDGRAAVQDLDENILAQKVMNVYRLALDK